MKRLVAVVKADRVEDVVDALVRQAVYGVTLEATAAGALEPEAPDGGPAEPSVRIEVVIESHRADEVIESIEAILESATRRGGTPRLLVETVEAVVHIRSGRVLT